MHPGKGVSDEPAVVWFRRDLRLEDNPAWAAATATHRSVIALFVVEPELFRTASSLRRDQLVAHLHALHDELADLGGGLVVRTGPARIAVPQVLDETAATGLFLNDDVTPFAHNRDIATLKRVAVPVHRYDGLFVHAPQRILTNKGTLSQVFTPFYNRWIETALTPWPEPGPGQPQVIRTDRLPAAGTAPQRPGTQGAWARLRSWLDQIADYPATRDFPAIDGTSQLSADLKFGTIAARTILEAAGDSTPGHRAFVRQLAWRDWWAHTLAQHPDLPDAALRPDYDRIVWRHDDRAFAAWADGNTGFPIVDAGMRQLVSTGWMHNRVRMITASFLVKDLLIDWRRGERFFRHHLVDADVAQNAGNWQWIAGTGPDAAPYFRVFNPTTQGIKFDPAGEYVRRWAPELARLSNDKIHHPAKAAPLDLAAAGVILGDTYPEPIVDHAQARERVLAAYKVALGGPD
ncbi:MAG: deoxyribodipyrimidine photo-lyase [Acidimicrobiales bacterium]|jgi:deoxyribodipyrimidine photo-lyase